MPNTKPAGDTPGTVRYILDKAKTADAHVYVAAAITKGLKGEELCDLKALHDAGAIALSDDGRPVIDTACLVKALCEAPKLHMRVTAHCEDLFLAKKWVMHEGEVSEKLNLPGVPAAAEDCGTAREIAAAAAYDVPVHICHVSTATSAALIRDAKARGVKVTAETAPHYLLLTDEALEKHDADYRMNPPLRSEKDRLAMIEAVKDGTIDVIATDHAPHTAEEKARDFAKAPSGITGLETAFSVCNTYLVKTGRLTRMQLLEKMSRNPAEVYGLTGRAVREGNYARLVLLDWDSEKIYSEYKSKGINTPYTNEELTGSPRAIVTGEKITE